MAHEIEAQVIIEQPDDTHVEPLLILNRPHPAANHSYIQIGKTKSIARDPAPVHLRVSNVSNVHNIVLSDAPMPGGDGNVVVGIGALPAPAQAGSNNNVVIGYSAASLAATSCTRSVVIGSFAGDRSPQIDTSVIIGSDSRLNRAPRASIGQSVLINAIPPNVATNIIDSVAIGFGATVETNTAHLGNPAQSMKFGVGNSGFGTAGQVLTVGAAGVEWAAAASSRKVKRDIEDLTLAEAQGQFDALAPKTFVYTDDASMPAWRGTRQAGFIAEELADAGMFVERDVNGDPRDLSERNLIAVLWTVVKDQQARIAALEARLS